MSNAAALIGRLDQHAAELRELVRKYPGDVGNILALFTVFDPSHIHEALTDGQRCIVYAAGVSCLAQLFTEEHPAIVDSLKPNPKE